MISILHLTNMRYICYSEKGSSQPKASLKQMSICDSPLNMVQSSSPPSWYVRRATNTCRLAYRWLLHLESISSRARRGLTNSPPCLNSEQRQVQLTRAMTVETEARPRQKLRDRGRGIWFEIEARPRQRAAEAELRPRPANNCLDARQLPRGLHHWVALVLTAVAAYWFIAVVRTVRDTITPGRRMNTNLAVVALVIASLTFCT